MSKEYADYQKLKHNSEYLEMLDRGYEDIRHGKGVHKTKQRIRSGIEGLLKVPPEGDIKKLKGMNDGSMRLRIARYR